VHELTAVPIDIGVDQDVLDRPVLTREARGAVCERLAGGESIEQIREDVSVSVKLVDVVATVLSAGIPEHAELGVVGPQDGAIQGNTVDPD